MRNSDKYDEFYNGRREFLKEMKYTKYKELGKNKGYKYNRATGSYLWIISRNIQRRSNQF